MKIKFACSIKILLVCIVLWGNLSFAQVSPPVLTSPADSAKNIVINPLFSWTAIPSATMYRILISTDSTFATGVTNQTSATNSYQSANLSYNKDYYWKVQVTVGGVTSAYSPVRTFRVKLSTPVLTSPAVSGTGIATDGTLSWQAVTGADNYALDVSVVNTFASTVYSKSDLTATSQAMSGLQNYQVYYWRVKATTTDGNTSDYSATRSFTTIQAPPALVLPADNATNYPYSRITYTWNSVTSAIVYDLQVCKNSSFTSDLKNYYSLTDTSYMPTDYFDNNQQYYWRVRVKVGSVYSDYSAVRTFTTGAPSTQISSLDANAAITFDHAAGRITEITYKKGSNKQLLNTYFNDKNRTGLARLNSETSTKVASWNESGTTWVYNYENSSYGSKTLTVSWDANGITVDVHVNLLANKAATFNAAWQPGGDNGPIHDYVLYANASDQLTKANLTYPGISSTIYNNPALLTAMYDDRYEASEFFGFKSSSAVKTSIQQSTSFGPVFSYSASLSSQTIDFSFAIKSKSNFFTWANKKYIIVQAPAAGDKLLNNSATTVTWDSYGVSGNINIDLSTTGAAPFATSLAAATANDGTQSVTLPNLSLPQDNCAIQVSGTGASGVSGVFSVASGTATTFSIPTNLTGSPTSQVSIPILVTPGTGASLNAFDIRLIYDKNLLSFISYTSGPKLTDWVVDATNNSTSGYIQIGGFINGGAEITSSGTLITLTFSIKSSSRVGTQVPLNINNSYISAADASALPLNVTGKDGLLTLYSRISGRLHYSNSLKTSVSGPDLVVFTDTENGDTTTVTTTLQGYYDFSNKKPGSVVTVKPLYSKVYADTLIAKAVKATDARVAFDGRDGGSTILTPLQKIAADINKDGIINSTDALAILQISTGALTATSLGNTQWIFIDSTYTLNSTNWSSAPQFKTYSPLDTVRYNQSFMAVVAGDVQGDYTPVPLTKTGSANSATNDQNTILYSVPLNMNICPTDTLYLPLSVKLFGKSIGAFNASIKVDENLLTYCGKYNAGTSLPTDKGWTLSTNFDQNGRLNIAGTDFSGAIDPITQDGPIAVFKFLVKNGVKLGDTCQVVLTGMSIADSRLIALPVVTKNGKVTIASVTATEKTELPKDYSISQNYPNPFNPTTVIDYYLPKESRVELAIYNVIGQKIAVLVNGITPAGMHKVQWNAKELSSGIYFYTIRALNSNDGKIFTETKKLILLK
jgi:hypothetical protein